VSRRTGLLLLLVMAALGAASVSDTASTPGPAQWLSYGHDAQLSNFVRVSGLTTASARRLRVAWQQKLDGPIVASPLYARGALFVETEAGSVYALRPGNGSVLWKRAFGAVAAHECGTWGFSSTGAIDSKNGTLYAIGGDGHLHALALANGRERPGWPLAITAAHFDGEYVWGGLRRLGRTLYVPVASYCDAPGSDGHLANGRVVAVDLDRHRVTSTFDPVPGDQNLGGIWGWGGVSVDPSGKALYAGVGNSHVFDKSCGCYLDTVGYGNALVKLSPRLRVLAWNRPKPVADVGDADLGTTPLLFRPSGCPPLAAGNGKIGRLFVWDRNRLGRGPRFSVSLADGMVAFVGQPSYSPTLRMVFDSHAVVRHNGKKVGDGVVAYSIDSRCRFHRRWLTSVGNGQEPAPLVAGAIVFAPGGDRGGFTAIDARTGKYLWRLRTASGTISPPIAAGGRIFAGDLGGTVRAFAPR
jgi:outer membrane protein assembly factor BamB